MAFCRNCGKEVLDEAVVCVHCGCAINNGNTNSANNNQLVDDRKATFIEVLGSILIPIIGWILFFAYRTSKPTAAKTCGLAGLIVWLLYMVLMAISV